MKSYHVQIKNDYRPMVNEIIDKYKKDGLTINVSQAVHFLFDDYKKVKNEYDMMQDSLTHEIDMLKNRIAELEGIE